MPRDPVSQKLSEDYLRSWEALGKMLEEGKSWSGRERNLAYLNTRDGRFTDVSTLAGLAFASDSRALALTDWDGDGDLDIWQANRSAPRVRFLLNQLDTNTRFLRLRLTGTTCNRDAIGARVSLALSNGKRLIKTLRAGEGYLSQSSKILHFGLPDEVSIQSLTVAWPGDSAPQAFAGIAQGKTYHLTQGREALAVSELPAQKLAAKPAPSPGPSHSSIRLIPHAKLPLPRLPYHTVPEQSSADVASSSQPTLVVLWAGWCQPCLHEIKTLAEATDSFTSAGLQVLLINVDDSPQTAAGTPPSFRQGIATETFLQAFDVTQRILTGREREAALPSSFLTDAEGRLIALYKGPVAAGTVLEDLALRKVDDSSFRDRAVPYPGRWLIASMPVDLIAIPERFLELEQTPMAYAYLEKHITGKAPAKSKAELPSLALTMPMVSQTYARTAGQFVRQENWRLGKQAYIRALQYDPGQMEPRVRLALVYEKLGDFTNAAEQLRQVLILEPQHLPTRNSLAWILATVPDPKLRNPAAAERLALEVCQATDFKMPEPLDTLAAAQAAAGKFDDAVNTARRALLLAEKDTESPVTAEIRQRLELYQQGKAYIQSP